MVNYIRGGIGADDDAAACHVEDPYFLLTVCLITCTQQLLTLLHVFRMSCSITSGHNNAVFGGDCYQLRISLLRLQAFQCQELPLQAQTTQQEQ